MNAFRFSIVVASSFVVVACSEPAPVGPTSDRFEAAGIKSASALSANASSPLSATVLFGQPNVGSPFPAPSGHDRSANAKDNLVPRTVVINRGGTVTFETFGIHGVAIYAPGTEPADIDTSVLAARPAGCPNVPLINDPDNRIAVLGTQPCAGGSTTPSYQFNNPGRYLVICRVLPHFVLWNMYGWVIVR